MTVRFGIVGSGFMGRTWAEVAANHASGTALVAVTGGRRAAALAADYDVALEPSLESLLARADVDAVVLASPPAGHREQTLLAAAAGKHLLVEKPMAQNAAECAAMVDACRSAGVRLSAVSQHRFRDVPVAARRLIDEGAIGDVRMVQVTGAEVGWWDMAARGDEWKLDPAQQTAYASWAAHACDLLRWFSGADGAMAFARITNFSGQPAGVGQSAAVLYEMTSGALAQVTLSYEFPRPGLRSAWPWLIMGSDGIIELDPYHEVRLGRGDEWTVVARQGPFDPLDAVDPIRLRAYARQMEDLVAAVVEGHDPLVSGDEGLRTVAMLEAAERSAVTGGAVLLADLDGAARST
ncbi:MAG: Gfo/Idh/MocA family oxidoreductase [Chloroflexi bacterium]|nr:Gfo/Idh/MocA family oxidoreductase [Chloroflexota bacterium]